MSQKPQDMSGYVWNRCLLNLVFSAVQLAARLASNRPSPVLDLSPGFIIGTTSHRSLCFSLILPTSYICVVETIRRTPESMALWIEDVPGLSLTTYPLTFIKSTSLQEFFSLFDFWGGRQASTPIL